MSDFLKNMVHTTLYLLKEQYGDVATFYKLTDASIDVRTGVRTTTVIAHPLTRVVPLPATYQRKQSKSKVAMGASPSHDISTRFFLIDQQDLPLAGVTTDDWIVFDAKKYQVKKADDCEVDGAWFIETVELVGERPNQVYYAQTDTTLGVTAEIQ